MNTNLRFYSLVAGLYLSELQKGLQTAHAVSEMYATYRLENGPIEYEMKLFDQWATADKTIIILDALNHGGVFEAYTKFIPLAADLGLPITMFREDEVSMNSMATATGIVVPEKFYDVKFEEFEGFYDMAPVKTPSYVYEHKDELGNKTGQITRYTPGMNEYSFIHLLKSYRRA